MSATESPKIEADINLRKAAEYASMFLYAVAHSGSVTPAFREIAERHYARLTAALEGK